MSMYFSSDWHLGHNNILKYDKRPFKSIEEHDEHIIRSYNEVVGPDDHFYFLGDFGLTDSRYLRGIFPRLNGYKHFIKGNHDKHDTIKLYEKYGIYLGEQRKIIGEDGTAIILNHFSMRVWDRCHKGAWHLYGHSHGNLKPEEWGKSMDVCVILNDYKPFSFKQIKRIMDKRGILLIDHHQTDEEREAIKNT